MFIYRKNFQLSLKKSLTEEITFNQNFIFCFYLEHESLEKIFKEYSVTWITEEKIKERIVNYTAKDELSDVIFFTRISKTDLVYRSLSMIKKNLLFSLISSVSPVVLCKYDYNKLEDRLLVAKITNRFYSMLHNMLSNELKFTLFQKLRTEQEQIDSDWEIKFCTRGAR